ncbi:MAG: GNAT family N-acetyltransferase [Rhodocyclaceae bacterium]|nr:GNAT family N-acetyltransferase [Rhodocyclaceae bacterium]
MTVVGNVANKGDIEVLGRLHVEILPESLVSLIGERYARSFYRYVSSSSKELVFLERDGSDADAVVGACVVSLDPGTLNRRLLRATPLIPMALLALPHMPLRSLLGGSRDGAKAQAPEQPPGPEIILIFTLPSLRSRGCGARLLARAEDWLAQRGVGTLYVKTRDAEDNRAIGFYERAGYRRLAAIVNKGKKLALFDKCVSIGQRSGSAAPRSGAENQRAGWLQH